MYVTTFLALLFLSISVFATPIQEVFPIEEPSLLPDSVIQDILEAHNVYREYHHAPALQWDDKLATYAQKWSWWCHWGHSHGDYGENLAAGFDDFQGGIDAWYNEVEKYDFDNPGFSSETGHFTQLVWYNTSFIGCGMTKCRFGKYYVCEYDPPGNILWGGDGDENIFFRENVLPH